MKDQPVWRLVACGDESLASEVFYISAENEKTTVGRDPSCSLCLRGESVSKRHANLWVQDGQLWLEDCGSTNGVFVNAKRVATAARLGSGDVVNFASVAFEVACDVGRPSVQMTIEAPALEATLADEVARRKEAQKKLLDAEAQSVAILHSIEEGIITCDRRGRIATMNPAACAMLKVEPGNCGGLDLRDFIPELDGASPSDASGDRLMEHIQAKPRTGEPFPVVCRVSESRLTDQVLLVVVFRDASLELAARRQLQVAKAAAEEANEAKSQFLANMTHELRTPMAAIIGFTDCLGSGELSEFDRQRAIESIGKNSRHLLALINDILDFAKIEAGGMTVDRVAMSPAEVIAEVHDLLRVIAAEKGLSLQVTVDPSTPRRVECDPTRLRQILTNLVGNSLKFTSAGSVTVECRSEVGSRGANWLIIRVTDTGPGIEPEALKKLFKPFTQADSSATRRFGGTGLGLSISQHLANLLGGEIVIESEPGVGTAAELRIAAPCPAEPINRRVREKATEHDGPKVADALPLRGRTILVADDFIDNRRILEYYLTQAGADVVTAEHGQAALVAAARRPLDAVVMDMQMPVMDGQTAARLLRERGFTGPILALTANLQRSEREKAYGCGCSHFLEKPAKREVLVASIAQSLKQRVPLGGAAPVGVAPAVAVGGHDGKAYQSALDTSDPAIAEIVIDFAAGLPAAVSELEAAFESGDHEAARRLAHRIRGSAGTMGFDCLTQPLAMCEEIAESAGDAGQYLAAVRGAVDKIIAAMNHSVAENAAGLGI